jgi:predicted phosphoribosyltransferase
MFKDRVDAGNLLAQRLLEYKDKPDAIVLGLPRGGVVTAYEVARILGLPLDIVVPRKIGAPQNQELAVAAIAEDGSLIINDQLMNYLGLQLDDLQNLIEKEKKESARRMKLYRAGRTQLDLADKTVILVDDGIATGGTGIETLTFLEKKGALQKNIMYASIVSAPEGIDLIKKEFPTIDIICAAHDKGLTKEKFIIPGLGDFGDRFFGTEA